MVGVGGSTINFYDGNPGEHGEDCGEVNIYNDITIYAFGGAGGTGGRVSEGGSYQSGGGGSGFPAARNRPVEVLVELVEILILQVVDLELDVENGYLTLEGKMVVQLILSKIWLCQ